MENKFWQILDKLLLSILEGKWNTQMLEALDPKGTVSHQRARREAFWEKKSSDEAQQLREWEDGLQPSYSSEVGGCCSGGDGCVSYVLQQKREAESFKDPIKLNVQTFT